MTVVASIQPGGVLEAGTFVEKPTASPIPYVHNHIGADYSQWRPHFDRGTHGYQYDLENCAIVTASNPWGRQDFMWRVVGRNGETNSRCSGGINNGSYVDQDGNIHRFSCWQRAGGEGRSGTTNSYYGRSYWGITDTGANVLRGDTGAEATNPYWQSTTNRTEDGTNGWVLFVGHVYPFGAGLPDTHADSGIYNTAGEKVRSSWTYCDYVCQEATRWRYRMFQYRTRHTDCYTHYYRPRIDTLDGNEPTIAELIAGTETGDVLHDPKHIYPDGTWSHGAFDETAASVSLTGTTINATGMTEV